MSKQKSIMADERYIDLLKDYQNDWIAFATAIVDKKPTFQQREIISALQEERARVSVSSGHGTGKSDLASILILAFIILNPESRVVVVANNAAQVRNVIWKYIKSNYRAICRNLPWIESYFVLNEREFYATGYKGEWSCVAKSAKAGNEEGLAGEHCHTYLVVVDEASGLADKALQVLSAALTEKNNNMLMLSQPTRPNGFFYDSHHKLAKTADKPDGIWTPIVLSSEESPLVTSQFIGEKLLSYGGADSTEYQIKVLGRFPSNMNDFLLTNVDCERAVRSDPQLVDKEWGWVAACDVGNGRDKSILHIAKVSLDDAEQRKVISHEIFEMPSDIDPIDFAYEIKKHVEPYIKQNITIVIDGDGIGFATVKTVRELGLSVQEIRWGAQTFKKIDRSRFINKRAQSHIMMRNAVKTGRLKIDRSEETKEQLTRLPHHLNEAGKVVICSKKDMREKHNISSPDRSDTYCFMFLANPVSMEDNSSLYDDDLDEAEFNDWLSEPSLSD